MKYIILSLIFAAGLFAGVVKSPIISVNGNIATIKIEKIDVGVSGFIVHKIAPNHSVVLKNAVVDSYDKQDGIAILKLSDYTTLDQDSLPNGKWHVEVGDTALLAFAYSRAFLVAPNEEIYHRVTAGNKSLQWIHPDIFATILSLNGHPTPLKEDFDKFSESTAVGIVFIYLNKKVFTLDAKSFKILNISDAPLKQESVKLPFFTRVTKIDANWWGEGSSKLEEYEPYYYKLMLKYNSDNKELLQIIKNNGINL